MRGVRVLLDVLLATATARPQDPRPVLRSEVAYEIVHAGAHSGAPISLTVDELLGDRDVSGAQEMFPDVYPAR